MDLEKYLKQGISYSAYFDKIQKQHKTILGEGDPKKLAEYYSLNIKRMERLNKTFQLSDEQKSKLKRLNNAFTLLIISEGWCGDASQVLPVISKIATELKVEEKIVFKDENLDLMAEYLTNGTSSIPIIIGVKEGKELFRFGPRPQHGMDLLKNHKENPDTYTQDDFHTDLQKWYNQDKGKTIFDELTATINEIK